MTTDVYVGGLPFSHAGALQVIPRPPNGVGANVARVRGIAVEQAGGMVYVADAGSAVPSDAFYMGGIALTADGAIYVTQDTSGTFFWNGGIKVRSDGAVLITNGIPVTGSGGALGAQGPNGGVSILGSGFAVNLQTSTTPWLSNGSATATFTRNTTAYVPGYAANAAVTDAPTALLLASGEAGFWGARRVSEGVWSRYDANGVLLVPASGAHTGLCDAYGNFGYFSGGARADVLGTTVEIRRKMTDVGWVSGGGGITVSDAVGFDGGATSGACLTASGANGTLLFTTVLGAAVRTYSAWVRRKTGTGTVEMTKDGGTSWTALTLTAAYPIVPFSVTTASAANPVVGFRIVTSGDAIEVDFNTLEVAAFANPTPIPVNVSKAADALTYVTSGNAITTVGSWYAEVMLPVLSGATQTIIGSAATTNWYYNAQIVLRDGANVHASALTLTANTLAKIAAVYSGSSMNTFKDGTAATASTFDGNMNLGATIGIGYDPPADANQLFGTMRNVRIYPSALPTSTLETLTT